MRVEPSACLILRPEAMENTQLQEICLCKNNRKANKCNGLSLTLKSNISLSEQFVVSREKSIRLQLEAAVNEGSKYSVVLMLFDHRPRGSLC